MSEEQTPYASSPDEIPSIAPARAGETHTVHDPFLGKDVEISDRLVDRLRGRYASGPTLPNGEPEFGWREFPTPPIQRQAAAEIERLRTALQAIADDVGVPAFILRTLAARALGKPL